MINTRNNIDKVKKNASPYVRIKNDELDRFDEPLEIIKKHYVH
jgi:hypothetical protein